MQNMNDVLFFGIPGVNVARRSNLGFMGPNSGFRIRGLKRERVAVFVDGIPSQVNNHFHPLVDQYTPDMIERIEYTRTWKYLLISTISSMKIMKPCSVIHRCPGLLSSVSGGDLSKVICFCSSYQGLSFFYT